MQNESKVLCVDLGEWERKIERERERESGRETNRWFWLYKTAVNIFIVTYVECELLNMYKYDYCWYYTIAVKPNRREFFGYTSIMKWSETITAIESTRGLRCVISNWTFIEHIFGPRYPWRYKGKKEPEAPIHWIIARKPISNENTVHGKLIAYLSYLWLQYMSESYVSITVANSMTMIDHVETAWIPNNNNAAET